MIRSRAGAVALVVSLASGSTVLAACQVGTGGEGQAGDAAADGPPAEAAADVSVADAAEGGGDAGDASDSPAPPPPSKCNAQNCGGACCGDQCVKSTCETCDAGGYFCTFDPTVAFSSGRCVSDCSACSPNGVKQSVVCYNCISGNPRPQCAAAAASCSTVAALGACTCPSGSASDCPSPTQTCQGDDAGNFLCVTH